MSIFRTRFVFFVEIGESLKAYEEKQECARCGAKVWTTWYNLGAMNKHNRAEEFRVNGGDVWANIKKFVRAGNIRHIIFQNKKGERALSMSVTFAVVIALLAPQFVFVFTIVVLAMGYSIIEEKETLL